MEYSYFIYCQITKEKKILDASNQGKTERGTMNLILSIPFEIKTTPDLRSLEALLCEKMNITEAVIINLSKM